MGKKKYTVVCQAWLESERGWGTRPDGYSLHLNEKDRKAFIEDYWQGMPDQAPDEYSKPDGSPYLCDIDEKTYQKVSASKNGVRFFDTPPVNSGDAGWSGSAVRSARRKQLRDSLTRKRKR